MSPSVTDDHPVVPFATQPESEPASSPRRRSDGGGDRRSPTSRKAATAREQEDPDVRRLYTVAMMADVLSVAPAAVRHWVRGGLLVATKRVGALQWFDFQQLVVGRALARLLAGGLSLREIDAKLTGLVPGGAGAAARQSSLIVVDGRRLSIRQGSRILGSGGQMQFGFYTDGLRGVAMPPGDDSPRVVRSLDTAPSGIEGDLADPPSGTELLDLAADLEANGEFVEAAEALRAFLQAEGQTAPVMFMLAELLYRSGDLTAARERYYATLELDADHLEARTSLGCVLAELGDHELALAALEGVLRQEPDYADAHWHLAGVLHDCGCRAESRRHLRLFLTLAPESPWATIARERLR
jgi:DNA-binding transcriptional MerR regulator